MILLPVRVRGGNYKHLDAEHIEDIAGEIRDVFDSLLTGSSCPPLETSFDNDGKYELIHYDTNNPLLVTEAEMLELVKREANRK